MRPPIVQPRRLEDGLVEETAGQRRDQMDGHGIGPGALSHQRDVIRVAAESGNVGPDPFKREDLWEGE